MNEPTEARLEALETLILDTRDVGNSLMGIQAYHAASVEDAARQFDLLDSPGIYLEVDAQEAEQVFIAALIEDMAHHLTLMSREQAAQFAAQLMSLLAVEHARFYSNVQFRTPRRHPWDISVWTPATDSTFDVDVLVISPGRIACAWFMDED